MAQVYDVSSAFTEKFLTLRLARDDVAHDENLTELRRLIGRRIVEHFASNPLGLNQYIASGQQPVLTEYEEEMQLLGKLSQWKFI